MAPRFRMLSIDLDGTLLTSDKRITPRTREAVRAARDAGVRVVICTARPPRSARPFYDELGLDTELIAYNGAMAVQPGTGEVLLHKAIPAGLAQRLLAVALEVDPEMVISFEKEDQWLTDARGAAIITDTAAAGWAPDKVCSLQECVSGPVTKMLASKDAETLRRLEAALAERLPELSVTRCDDYLLQIAAPGVCKEAALAELLAARGWTADDLAAIGDAPNDLGMLRFAALGLAVGNAPPEVQAAADGVVASNDEDGAAEAIERYVLPAATEERSR